MQRKIVTLCGSTRFYAAFQEANYREVLVLNVDDVGESTRNEIAYAVLTNKSIRWLDEQRGGDAWLEEHAHDLGARVHAHVKAGR